MKTDPFNSLIIEGKQTIASMAHAFLRTGVLGAGSGIRTHEGVTPNG